MKTALRAAVDVVTSILAVVTSVVYFMPWFENSSGNLVLYVELGYWHPYAWWLWWYYAPYFDSVPIQVNSALHGVPITLQAMRTGCGLHCGEQTSTVTDLLFRGTLPSTQTGTLM